MGIMVCFLFWAMQDLYHQPYRKALVSTWIKDRRVPSTKTGQAAPAKATPETFNPKPLNP